MAHDPSLGHADYVSAANAAATTLMPAMDEGGTELFGLQSGMEMIGMRGLAVMPGAMAGASAHSKPVLIDGASTISFLGEQHHQPRQAPLSLSLYGPEGVLHQHHGAISSSSPRQLLPAAWPYGSPHGAWHLRSSRFLLPAQQLLQEFCSLPVESTRPGKPKAPNDDGSDGGGRGSSSTTSWSQSPQIQALDALDLQKLKDKLYIMLEEVDGRYRRYCEQMRGLVDAFEAVAGGRAAAVYTAQAARTMSRHFRNLRDGIVGQIQAVRKALGEKDTAVPGKTKGETPRLRALDQCLRQQRALHQAAMVESHPWRPQRGLPERAVSILRAWLFEHFLHPYPSDMDKHILARQTSLSRSQVSNWFINARVRLWKPMVEEMYKEEMKEQEGSHARLNPNPTSNTSDAAQDEDGADDEQKPTQAQLLHDTGSLASVVNATHGNRARGAPTRPMESFGIMDHLDFDPYDGGQGFSSGGVSLTLGLQQHDSHGSGVNVAFAAPAAGAHGGAGFLFPGEQMEGVHSGHDHHGQFGAGMEAEASHGQVHYRGLSTGFQLLRDLAG